MDDSSALPVTDYVERYGITEARDNTKDDVVITHPGPVNRGLKLLIRSWTADPTY